MLARLPQYRQDALRLDGEFESLRDGKNWAQLLTDLEATTWVSHIQPPPKPGQSAGQVLKYLARYLGGGPISDHRIVSTDQDHVTLMARQGESVGGSRQQIPITLSQVEFTRRWCLHVLPSGYTRTRRFAGWSNTRRESYLELFAKLLEAAEFPLPPEATDFGPFEDLSSSGEDDHQPCPKCAGPLIPHRYQENPSWSWIMDSPHRPAWYLRL